jgi:DnaK suppressor protein
VGKKDMSLSASQRKHLERRLLEERSRAQRTLSRSVDEQAGGDEQDRSGDLTSMPLHMADRGTDTMQQELEASNATRVSRELAEIDAALERLYQTPDKFGICEDTGEDIPFARLDIIPWARTCEDAKK